MTSINDINPYFERIETLGGSAMMEILADTSVLIFGVGGVGSWCAEILARNAVGHLTIVDDDIVAPSNINRQLPALSDTIGLSKAEVLAERFTRINPATDIRAATTRYTPDTAGNFNIESYDYVIDAIDSLADKADLIIRCTDTATAPRHGFFSSMGAARKINPEKIQVSEFWKAEGCPLARALRTRFRRSGVFPKRKFKVVFSPETMPQNVSAAANGTFAHITAMFGIRLAALVVNDIYARSH